MSEDQRENMEEEKDEVEGHVRLKKQNEEATDEARKEGDDDVEAHVHKKL